MLLLQLLLAIGRELCLQLLLQPLQSLPLQLNHCRVINQLLLHTVLLLLLRCALVRSALQRISQLRICQRVLRGCRLLLLLSVVAGMHPPLQPSHRLLLPAASAPVGRRSCSCC